MKPETTEILENPEASETISARVTVPEVPLGSKIIRSVVFGALRYLLLAPIPFVMTPLILHKIGVAGYGTWAVFLAINGMTSLADLGLVGTVSKFVAEYHTHRDFTALNRLLSSGLALFLGLSLIVCAVIGGATPIIIRLLLRGSPAPYEELVFLLHCFLVVVTANIFILLFSSITSGLQRVDLTYVIGAANIFLSAAGGGFLLLRGWGLRGLVYGYMGSAILTVVAYIMIVRRLLPQVVPNPLRFDQTEARKMFDFSLRLYITQAAVAVHNQIEKLFLAMFIGVGPVGWFEIASDVALKIRGTMGFILSPVLPAASELNALHDEVRMEELYYRTHKYLALIGVPAVCYVVAISSRFVELWLGPSLRMVALPLSILVVVNFLNLATGPGFCIFAGRGYLKPGVESAILGIVLNIVLSLALIYKFGFAGAVIGTSASLILASAFFVSVFHRKTRYPYGRLLRQCYLKPTLCSLLVMAALLAIRGTKGLSWFGLVAMGLVFEMLYSMLILISHFFDAYDWNKMEGFAPVLRRLRRIVGNA